MLALPRRHVHHLRVSGTGAERGGMDRTFYRWGGAAAVVGGVLALLGNLMAPRWTDIDDVERYRKIADSGIWRIDALILVFAIILVTVGTVAVAKSLEGGGADGLAGYG